MIGGAPRQSAIFNAAVIKRQTMADRKPIQCRNGSSGMKRPARRMNLKPSLQSFKPLAPGPFVEVSSHHRMPAVLRRMAQHLQLRPAITPPQTQMGCNQTEPACDIKGHAHSTPGLEPRQVQAVDGSDLEIRSHQNRIPVPAKAHPFFRQIKEVQIGFRFDQFARNGGFSRPVPPVGFLQNDDVGIQAVDNLQRALRHAFIVKATRLANIITCETKTCI